CVAAPDLLRQRLVAGGNALDGIDDACVLELETIVRRDGLRAGGEARVEQRSVEKLPRVIAGEGPPGSIRAMQPRREPDEDDPRVRNPKGGYGPRPVVRIAPVDLGQEFREPRAARA